MEDECGDIPMVLVQNKIDLITQSFVTNYEVESVAIDTDMKLYKTSVKEDLNVDLVFQHLAENYVRKVNKHFIKIHLVILSSADSKYRFNRFGFSQFEHR